MQRCGGERGGWVNKRVYNCTSYSFQRLLTCLCGGGYSMSSNPEPRCRRCYSTDCYLCRMASRRMAHHYCINNLFGSAEFHYLELNPVWTTALSERCFILAEDSFYLLLSGSLFGLRAWMVIPFQSENEILKAHVRTTCCMRKLRWQLYNNGITPPADYGTRRDGGTAPIAWQC